MGKKNRYGHTLWSGANQGQKVIIIVPLWLPSKSSVLDKKMSLVAIMPQLCALGSSTGVLG